MSKESELFCPECEGHLVYCHGTIKIPYFRHKVEHNCELDLTGETEEHKKGKLLIYDFLKMKYSDSYVDLEYKIQETGQRADVICIFPNGETFAFEIQCSKIPIDKWVDRYNLYEKAGVNQIWIAGKNLIKEISVLEENPTRTLYKFSGLAEEIYEKQTSLPLIDVDNSTIDVLHQNLSEEDYFYERQRSFPHSVKTPLDTTYLYEGCLVNDVIKAAIDEVEEEHHKYLLEMEIKRENAIKRKTHKIEHSKKYLNVFQKTDVRFIRDRSMTPKEQWLFNKLVTKHQYTINNFPGIFQTVVNYMEHIVTPPILWQLWIYDRFIYGKSKEKNKLWVPRIKEQFEKMVKKNIFRLAFNNAKDEHFSFAFWEFIAKLNEIGIVRQLSYTNFNYYEILTAKFPIYDNIEKNKLISIACSSICTRSDFDISLYLQVEEQQYLLAKNTLIEFCKDIKPDETHPKEMPIDDITADSLQLNNKTVEEHQNQNNACGVINQNSSMQILIRSIINIYETDNNSKLNPKGLILTQLYADKVTKGIELSDTEETILMRIQTEIEHSLKISLI